MHPHPILHNLKNKTLIMGILNLTPDSFYDGNTFNTPQKALHHALQMQEQGAHIIDIGAQSTHPKNTPISPQTEISRLLPILKELKHHLHIPISIDTQHASVAEAALLHGASIINDVSGLNTDPALAHLAAQHNTPIILMHPHKASPPYPTNITTHITQELKKSIHTATQAHIPKDNIIIDPGFGFGQKTPTQNLSILKNLHQLKTLNHPILIGTSRKGTLSGSLHATTATTTIATLNGANIIRVHDVLPAITAVTITQEIYN